MATSGFIGAAACASRRGRACRPRGPFLSPFSFARTLVLDLPSACERLRGLTQLGLAATIVSTRVTDEKDPTAGPGSSTDMEISICIVTLNCWSVLQDCLESLACAEDKPSHEVILVDNASTDGTAGLLQHHSPWVRFVENREK